MNQEKTVFAYYSIIPSNAKYMVSLYACQNNGISILQDTMTIEATPLDTVQNIASLVIQLIHRRLTERLGYTPAAYVCGVRYDKEAIAHKQVNAILSNEDHSLFTYVEVNINPKITTELIELCEKGFSQYEWSSICDQHKFYIHEALAARTKVPQSA
jgi:hypothetical protein